MAKSLEDLYDIQHYPDHWVSAHYNPCYFCGRVFIEGALPNFWDAYIKGVEHDEETYVSVANICEDCGRREGLEW